MLPVYHIGKRDNDLDATLVAVVECGKRGKRIALHCNESYHRGPVLLQKVVLWLFDVSFEKSDADIRDKREICPSIRSEPPKFIQGRKKQQQEPNKDWKLWDARKWAAQSPSQAPLICDILS